MTDHDTVGDTGYSLDEVSAYLDRGRQPRIDAIEADPEAQALLAAMERVAATSRAMLDEDEQTVGAVSADWYARLLETISHEVRSGASLPLEHIDEHTTTSITEGALRELARAAGDAVDDVLVGRVRLHHDDEPVTTFELHVTIGVRFGLPLDAAAARVRSAIHDALLSHSPAPVRMIDVEVADIFAPRDEGAEDV